MTAQRERVRELGGHDAAAAERRVADDADPHGTCLQQRPAHHRFFHDHAFGKADAGERAELRVAALDQLAEGRRRQPRRHRVRFGRRKLARIARQRLLLPLVVRRHVDDERRRRGVVDEVVADPVGAPRRVAGLVAPQAAGERRDAEHLARGAVIGMPIVPVRDGNRARTVAAQDVDGRSDQLGRRRDAAVRPPEVLAPGRTEHARRRIGFEAPLLRRPVRRQLGARQIAESDGVPGVAVARNRARRGRFRCHPDGDRTR